MVEIDNVALRERLNQLEQENQILTQFMESSSDAFFVYDSDLTLIEINPAALALVESQRSEMIGTPIEEVPALSAKMEKEHLCRRVLEEGDAIFLDNVTTSSTLGNRHLNIRIFKTRNGVGVSATDVTNYKLAEEHSRKDKDYLDTILHNLPIGVAIMEGPEFRYSRINQKMAEINGLPVAEHMGRPMTEVLTDPGNILVAHLNKVVETGEPILHREYSVENLDRRNNEAHYIDWLIPIKNNEQQLTAIVSVVLEVSELKEAQAQLRQAQKMEAIGTLAGGIAHDFNNILGAILLNAELSLLDFPEGSDERRNLELIIEGGERAANLVKQILTFSRMDAAKFEQVDLCDVVEKALQMAQSAIPAHITLEKNMPEGLSQIKADSTQIQQIILNLCANASHAMEENGGDLKVSICELTEPPPSMEDLGPCLQLVVQDTGKGIALEDRERIFDPFFTTKSVGKGTGLGLSVVHGTVENHHGKLELESTVGKGTTISIYLPISSVQPEEPELQSGISLDQPTRILIVEDELAISIAYRLFLEKEGFDVTVCSDGAEALSLFKRDPDSFDVVLTDQAMPHMTGKQLSIELLAIRPQLPIILSTGYSEVISQSEAKALGIKKYMMKPLGLKTLHRLIEECLD